MSLSIPRHGGQPLAPHDLWTSWSLEPSLLVPLVLVALAYTWGTRAVWRRAGTGHGVTVRGALYFAGAVLALVVALVSPLDALSGSLFSAHMVQHLVLVLVAAPLLVLGDPQVALLWALPRRAAKTLGRVVKRSFALSWLTGLLGAPAAAWLLFAAALWLWHAPVLYEAALRSELIHDVEHLVFLGTSLLFWSVLLRNTTPGHMRYGMAVMYLFTTALQSSVLGALMTFSSEPWYSYYANLVGPWSLTALEDQQLAGLVMWIPGGAVFTGLAIGYFAVWLRAVDVRTSEPRRSSPSSASNPPDTTP
jgi:putative membrane protein